jgi:hypothetical protein
MMLVDFDGSGEVGYHEFIMWWQEFHLTRLFQAADRDGRGSLKLAECIDLCDTMEFTEAMMVEARESLAAYKRRVYTGYADGAEGQNDEEGQFAICVYQGQFAIYVYTNRDLQLY